MTTNFILQALQHQLQQHTPYTWTLWFNTLSTPHWYNSPLTITHKDTTLTITTYEPNDNNPTQDYPDIEITTTVDQLDPNFLHKILNDYRLKKQG